jgi:hypothetical protein
MIIGGLAKLKFPNFRSILTLVQLLGLGAFIMACFTGSFFGGKLYDWYLA